jgi:urease accessory protein
MIESAPRVHGGATILPNSSGVMIRLLGSFASDVRNVIYEVVRISRRVILNATFSGIRKG